MRPNSITYRILIAMLALALLSFYGMGCGSDDDDDDDDDVVMDDPTDQPPGDGVSFAADIQPIFTNNCVAVECHGPNPPSGLELSTYIDFTQGGDSGAPFKYGNSADSLIIKRLEGTIEPQMPKDKAPLADDLIQKIKDWIDEGALEN